MAGKVCVLEKNKNEVHHLRPVRINVEDSLLFVKTTPSHEGM
jgi:hypothetical protein